MTSNNPPQRHILLLEDEELAARQVQTQLRNHFGEQVVITWLQSVGEGMTFLRENTPDLILSDIELLDGRAFIIYEHLEITAPIIFTTAYDQYLLDAFHTNGIAYLLKPFTEEALRKALRKYETLFQSQQQVTLSPAVLAQLQNALDRPAANYKQRFTIKKSKGIFLLKVADISYFQADNNIVFAVEQSGKKHIVNHKLSDLEQLLDPVAFFRINRSEIVHIHYIEKMEPYFNNRLAVTITGSAKPLISSSAKTAAFRKWIEGE